MWAFNVVVTLASEGRYRGLLADLAPRGEFHRTDFLGVVLGRVEVVPAFLEAVRAARAERLIAFQDLGRVIPLDRVFPIRAETFLDQACAAVRPYLGALAGKRFYVRLERRGLKGRIVSPEAEREIDAFIEAELAGAGATARVDFEHPDAVVVVEMVGDRCGVGLLTRETMERYDFVRVG